MNRRKNISAVIFDCDGVMFDSRQANVNFYNDILDKFNLPPMNREDEYFVHIHTAEDSVKHIFRGTPYTKEAEELRKNIDYTPFIKYMVIEPGLITLLKELKPAFGLAIATNRSNTIGAVLESFQLTTFFDIVISSLDVARPKPHPESIIRILDYFSISPAEAVYIGDSSIDLETALAAGVHFVAYRNRSLQTRHRISRLMDVIGVMRDLEIERSP
jgi:HAD superfamily hydrolase (TIGR01509 family)